MIRVLSFSSVLSLGTFTEEKLKRRNLTPVSFRWLSAHGWAPLPASHLRIRWSAGLWLWRRTSNSGVIVSFWHRVTRSFGCRRRLSSGFFLDYVYSPLLRASYDSINSRLRLNRQRLCQLNIFVLKRRESGFSLEVSFGSSMLKTMALYKVALSSPVLVIVSGYLRMDSGVVPVEHPTRSSGGDAPINEVWWMFGPRARIHLR